MRLLIKIIFLLLVAVALGMHNKCQSQPGNFFLEKEAEARYEYLLLQQKHTIHTSIKPLLRSEVEEYISIDSLRDSLKLPFGIKDSSFFKWQNDRGQLGIDPLLSFLPGYQYGLQNTSGKATWYGDAGLRLFGGVGDRFYATVNLLGGSTSPSANIAAHIDSTRVIPAVGDALNASSGQYIFRNLSGYASYSTEKFFNFQLGHGKHFFGNGYRSLLLSDASNNYSYFKTTATFWKVKYVLLVANLKDIGFDPNVDYGDFQNKYTAIHYLSWNVADWLNLGLFEAVVWRGEDTLNTRGMDVNYLNPVVFYRPVEYSTGSADNSLIGLNLNVKITPKIHLYHQTLLDEFLLKHVKADVKHALKPDDPSVQWGWWANKYAYQFGFKWFDAFGIKRVVLQAEHNAVRPFTYAHVDGLQNYAHFNQPLGHYFGANLKEYIAIIRYQGKRWSVQNRLSILYYGKDESPVNYGTNVYEPYVSRPSEFHNAFLQGIKTRLMYNEWKFSYLVYPRTNLRVEAVAAYRQEQNENMSNASLLVHLGVRTALFNRYITY